jgi:hypothetical protein
MQNFCEALNLGNPFHISSNYLETAYISNENSIIFNVFNCAVKMQKILRHFNLNGNNVD